MKNYRRNNYIGKMKKGFKQKLSLLMIACLLFTGYQGLTISGRADSSHPEQNNEIEVSGSQVKVQLLGADLRRAATEAILKGEKVGKGNLASYSKDQELAAEFEEYFDGEKEIYNIPLNSIAENLEESLNAEEAGLQIYVERDAKNLEKLVRKESKESLLLYSKESAVAGLLPKKEEATTVSLTEEEKASDSNLERNTELTGSELITFVYENKSTERMAFQLSVDGNKYPKVTVSSKTSLFKQFLSDAKKAQAEAKNAKATEIKAETTAAQTTEEAKAEVESTEAKRESTEAQTTEESKASEEAQKDSDVAIVSTAAEATEESLEVTEAKAEEKVEASEEVKEEKTEAPADEAKEVVTEAETAKAEKATEAVKASAEDTGLLKEITEHSEEFLPELHTVRFTQYSLNELGRKSQNVEVEGFGNVQVFYEEAAFDRDVVLEAKRLFKPEEEAEGEKLSEEQVNILKEKSLYEDSASLDIRFVDRKDNTVEVEPKSPVSVRITIEKKALPEEAKAEDISIHHIVEEEGSEKPISVETVSRSDKEKNNEKNQELNTTEEKESKNTEDKISKEFTVNSFSAYVVSWKNPANDKYGPIRFHFVDENYKELAPSIYTEERWIAAPNEGQTTDVYFKENGIPYFVWQATSGIWSNNSGAIKVNHGLLKFYGGYKLKGLYAQNIDHPGHPYTADGLEVTRLSNKGLYWNSYGTSNGYVNFGSECKVKEFYFVYQMCTLPRCKSFIDPVDPDLLNDKYITDNKNGTYDITLTAQAKRGADSVKVPLDVLFVYDNTGNINGENATKTKDQIYKLMDDLSAEKSGFDARFALVSMNSESKPTYNSSDLRTYDQAKYSSLFNKNDEAISGFSPIVGELGDLSKNKTSPSYSINDSLYNDLKTHEFSDKETIKNVIRNLPQHKGEGTGANYAAAIQDARSLMNWVTKKGNPSLSVDPSDNNLISEWGNFQKGHTRNENLWYTDQNNLVRKNAKAIVVFITGGNPAKTYVPQDGIYDNYIKEGNSYYLTRAQYFKGQSIGTNGTKVNFPALNTAKAALKYFVSLDGFYTIGVGDKQNWDRLEEFASVLPRGTDYKNFDASNPALISQSFKALSNEIAATQISNVSIVDTLSENVELVNGSASVRGELVKMKPNRVEVERVLSEAERKDLGLEDIKVSTTTNGFDKPDRRHRTIISLKTTPEDFVLPMGYELRLIANVQTTEQAEKNMAYESNIKIGDPRTDLNDIFDRELGKKYGEVEKYGTSAGKKGLYTNDSATVTFKHNDPKKKNTPPTTREYKKPIVKVVPKGYIRIDKTFKGLGDKIVKNGELTELGKLVLKNINFKIYTKGNNGEELLLTSVNLGDEQWANLIAKTNNNGFIVHNGYRIGINNAKTNADGDYTLGFTIYNLEMKKEYRIIEEIISPDAIMKESNNAVEGYYFVDKDPDNSSTYKENWVTVNHSSNATFVNRYKKKESPKNNVIVKKEVSVIGGPDTVKAEQARKFDFYLAVRDRQNVEYTKEMLEKTLAEFDKPLRDRIDIVKIPNVIPNTDNPIPPEIYVFHFRLNHDEEIEIPLDVNLPYNVIEKQEEDYDRATITYQKGMLAKPVKCYYFDKQGLQFTCTGYLTEHKEITKFTNPKKLPIPTGIVRDVTPYVFGIFGFVAMAGAYLTINKKRREA